MSGVLDVALATCRDLPDLHPDDHPLLDAFRALGLTVAPVLWGTPVEARAVLLRSTWDYHLRLDEFLAWCASCPVVFNPLETVRWNAHKGYLRDLDVPVVPTVYLAPGEPLRAPWPRVVIKPAVSAGALDTRAFAATDPVAAEHLARVHQRCDAMVQPYLASIEGYGERSLLFFDGVFSHAIRKHPFGGSHEPEPRVVPTGDELEIAARCAKDTVYARVDLVRLDDGTPAVMEVELIEPSLFFHADPAAPARLAAAVARRL